MWILEVPNFSENEESSKLQKLVLPNKTYLVGRSESIEICLRNPANPHMISDRQFSFTTQPVFSEEITPLTITVMGRAKMTVNGTDKIKHSSPASPVTKRYDKLKEISVEIGSAKKGMLNLTFRWIDMNFAFSKDDLVDNTVTISEHLNSLFKRDYSQIINFDSNMQDSTTHFLKTDKLSTKLALALVRQIKIVNMDFINVLSQSFNRKVSDFNDILSLDDSKIPNRILPTHLCLMEYNYSKYFPSYIDYVPEKEFLPNSFRKMIFNNLIFIVTNSVQYDNLHYVIESGNGKIELFDLSKNFGLNNENYKSQFKEKFKSFVKAFIHFLKHLLSNESFIGFDIILFKNMTIDFTKKVEVLNYEILKKAAELLHFELFTNKNFFDLIKAASSDSLTGFKVNKALLLNLEKLDYFLDIKGKESVQPSQKRTLDTKNDDENNSNEIGNILGTAKQRRQRRLRTTSVASLFGTPSETLGMTVKSEKVSHATPPVISEEDTSKSLTDSIKFMSAESEISQPKKIGHSDETQSVTQTKEPEDSTSQVSVRSRRQRKSTVDSLFGLNSAVSATEDNTKKFQSVAIPEEDENLQDSQKAGKFISSISRDDVIENSDNDKVLQTAATLMNTSNEKQTVAKESGKVTTPMISMNKHSLNPKSNMHSTKDNPTQSEYNCQANGKISIVTAIQKAKSLEEHRIKHDLGEEENTTLLSTEELERIKNRLQIENIEPERPHNTLNISTNSNSNSNKARKNFKKFVKKLPRRLMNNNFVSEKASVTNSGDVKQYVSFKFFDPTEKSQYVDKDEENEKFMDSKMRADINEEVREILSPREASIVPNRDEEGEEGFYDASENNNLNNSGLSQFKFTSNHGYFSDSSKERLFVAESDDENDNEIQFSGKEKSPILNTQKSSSGVQKGSRSATEVSAERSTYKIRKIQSQIGSNSISHGLNLVNNKDDDDDDDDDDEDDVPKFKFST